MKIQALNGADDQLTLGALKRAASKATGQARATIQGLIQSLTFTTAARGRSAKEASVKKHRKRAAKRTARRKTNPTDAPKAYKARKHRRTTRHNPSGGFSGKLNTADMIGVLKDGAMVAVGALGSSFLERQAERILPDLNPSIRAIAATGVVAGAAMFFGGKDLGKNIAVGAIAEGIRAMGRTFMPSIFAGTEEEEGVSGAEGYWDENGQWVMSGYEDEEVSGLTYSLSDPAPTLAVRPAGF